MYSNNDDNPFRVHRGLLEHCISRYDPEASGWNAFFEKKPSTAQLIDWLDINEIKCDNNTILRKQRLTRKKHGSLECYLITLSFDKCGKMLNGGFGNGELVYDNIRIRENMMKALDTFRNVEYKWSIDPIAVCEFNTKTGFNPHIHIVCKKNYESSMKCSGIQQACQRKFQKEYKGRKNKVNYEIYNVNVRQLPVTAGEDYVNGLKQDNKQEYLDKDKRYREEFGYDNLYYLFDNKKTD